MPTQHVEPDAEEYLRDVANALLKARKVVVITGAGISTNSGIPDFRSENGLYSLIQSQFEAASSRQVPHDESTEHNERQEAQAAADDARPAKRRKISVDATNESDSIVVKAGNKDCNNAFQEEVSSQQHADQPETVGDSAITTATQIVIETRFRTPQSKAATPPVELDTSPLSSPPVDNSISPSAFRSQPHRRLADVAFPLGSSPLSSPPPTLFDPFEPNSPSESSSGRLSSTSLSEVDETDAVPNSFASSQSSAGSKSTLPNMRGKDLFDANIWSDPIRTSVFYTFATSLRQKIRNAEPTTSHRFISHLRDRGKLVRCYTQNIDQIEEKVGLSTRLQDGPGSRGRFSRRSTANLAQLNMMVEEAKPLSCDKPVPETSGSAEAPTESNPHSQSSPADENTSTPAANERPSSDDQAKEISKISSKELLRSGVECVFLHGSLDLLRCFLCGKVCSWDDDGRQSETLSGQQPECPHCVGATVAREERGKRALGVGKLRPDIVLYGEEHPNSHLISPIITHDLGLYPDMLLILGTSLRVHGLKVMVREFAKAVHSKGGKVVFVNFTKPPDSIWGDIIDYWVQWDCDAWVADLQVRVPKLWQQPDPPKPRRKRESSGTSEDSVKEEKRKKKKKKPPPANPVALRDTKVTGAYWTLKVLSELHRITGHLNPKTAPARRTSLPTVITTGENTNQVLLPNAAADGVRKETKSRLKRSRRSAPGALEKSHRRSSTLNPNHGRCRKKTEAIVPSQAPDHWCEPMTSQALTPVEPCGINSILSSVKENARVRKKKRIYGDENSAPTDGRRRRANSARKLKKEDLKLPPLQKLVAIQPAWLYGKPQPLEPKSPPSGPLASLSPNLQIANAFRRRNVLIDDILAGLQDATQGHLSQEYTENMSPAKSGERKEVAASFALPGSGTSPVVTISMPQRQLEGSLDGRLKNWGSTWSCKQ
ncbi:hypothetical protein ED733_000354 [Metarhizium rileyi]|uniref:Deacetylase sirtuin-type domain-containing protein n=1 Tax=Metarhizium rileyi (strain RCEF 4871) TaxID=1649241 RepID=A0A5C6G779_METRR|nr:hypothetical protein ED733_000354 [Metarhizium rileyi]